ncbi:H(2)-dependent methylenetetrahydromethanopterin dehydrogenase-related protein [Methanocaldococcus infernus]
MKISIYGAGNQKLYLERLKIHERFGGNLLYGGAAMAIEMAKAGHDVILAEPNKNKLSEEQWEKVESANVKVTDNDLEAARHGEIHIFFTPFGKSCDIIKNVIEKLPENSVICTTCTVNPLLLYYELEPILRLKRKDIGVSSFHPASVPGTELNQHYVIAGETLTKKKLATDEQINKLVELCKSINKKPYVVPAELVSAVADMGVLVTALALSGILCFYYLGTRYIKAPKDMIEKQIINSLYTVASLVESSGVEGMAKALNPELVIRAAKSMLLVDKQKDLELALDLLSQLSEESLKDIEEAEVKETYVVATQELVKEIEKLGGKRILEGIIRRSQKRLLENTYCK